MTNAPPPTAEIVEALEALAVENDEVDAVVSGGEHRAPLLRLAASRLAELAAENERMRAALEPFAQEAEKRVRPEDRNDDSIGMMVWIADLRRARAAREQSK